MLVQAPFPQERYVVNALMLMTGDGQSQLTLFPDDDSAKEIVFDTARNLCWVRQGVGHYHRVEIPRIREVISDAARFEALRLRWHQQRGATSSITQMALCPAYQRIIGMGAKAIPFILRELEDRKDDPDHWFWALQAITGEEPVPAEHRGDMKEMARDWLEWAYLAGYDW
jgi:hypothetical protein